MAEKTSKKSQTPKKETKTEDVSADGPGLEKSRRSWTPPQVDRMFLIGMIGVFAVFMFFVMILLYPDAKPHERGTAKPDPTSVSSSQAPADNATKPASEGEEIAAESDPKSPEPSPKLKTAENKPEPAVAPVRSTADAQSSAAPEPAREEPEGLAPNVAGARPAERPATAPTISQFSKTPQWYGRALTGLRPPYPASFRFLDDQGAWYTPFTRPGMVGPYDLRGFHQPFVQSGRPQQ